MLIIRPKWRRWCQVVEEGGSRRSSLIANNSAPPTTRYQTLLKTYRSILVRKKSKKHSISISKSNAQFQITIKQKATLHFNFNFQELKKQRSISNYNKAKSSLSMLQRSCSWMNLKPGLNWCLSRLSFRPILHCPRCFHALDSLQHFFFLLLNLLPWIFCYFLIRWNLLVLICRTIVAFWLFLCSCGLPNFEFQLHDHLMTRYKSMGVREIDIMPR